MWCDVVCVLVCVCVCVFVVCRSAVGLVVKYLVAIEMPRVRFPDGAFFCPFALCSLLFCSLLLFCSFAPCSSSLRHCAIARSVALSLSLSPALPHPLTLTNTYSRSALHSLRLAVLLASASPPLPPLLLSFSALYPYPSHLALVSDRVSGLHLLLLLSLSHTHSHSHAHARTLSASLAAGDRPTSPTVDDALRLSMVCGLSSFISLLLSFSRALELTCSLVGASVGPRGGLFLFFLSARLRLSRVPISTFPSFVFVLFLFIWLVARRPVYGMLC